MRFSEAEFNTMLRELFEEEPARFDTLCVVAEKYLLSLITSWCNRDGSPLKGGQYEFDVLQKAMANIITGCMTGFFYHDGRTTPNTDMSQFCRWITIVAKNVFKDECNVHSKHYTVEIGTFEERIGDEEGDNYLIEDIDAIFDVVLSLNMGVYKLLAWLCVSVVILNETDKRSVATDIVVDRLGKATLDEMLEFLLRELRYYPALMPSDAQLARVRASLDELDELGVRMGDRPFYTFFMAKGGKYSVSDWLHKINKLIKRNS